MKLIVQILWTILLLLVQTRMFYDKVSELRCHTQYAYLNVELSKNGEKRKMKMGKRRGKRRRERRGRRKRG